MSKFTHLHVHSHYSLLNALPKIKELVEAAKKNEMSSLALTDNGNMYGAIEFYKACKKENIKPIIGVDFYIAVRARHDKASGVDNRRSRLVLLAKSEVGYKNLIKLATLSNIEGFYYKPRIDWELLEKYNEDLVCILPFWSGEVSNSLKTHDTEQAEKILKKYKETFTDCYLEITGQTKVAEYDNLKKDIVRLSKTNEVSLVATNDVYYLNPSDKEARETLVSIQMTGERDRYGLDNEADFSFIDSKKAKSIFKDLPEAIENTSKIAEMCNLELKLGTWVFPDYKIKSGSANDELKRLVYEGIEKRDIKKTKEVEERLSYELEVISSKGYSPYFLVVSDLLRFARKNNILTNTRGSTAGSLVAYLVGITTVDPIHFHLPFERFLNPYRPSPPDIDMDFADNGRDKVIEYAREKYGDDKVAQIGTFGTMAARGAVRDVARAMGYPYSLGDKIAKVIPFGSQGFPMTIDKALESTQELKEMYKKEEDVKRVIDMAKKIEGCARHISVHAAGVVISPSPITDFIPLQWDPKGENKVITQYDMHSVEDAGLLKFDFLGITNLAIMADAIERVERKSGKKINIDKIPLDDKKTFEMLSRGETFGVFQMGSSGMTHHLVELKPTSIDDLNAMVALYRPGPMATIDEYIARKQGRKKISFYHPKMEKFLDRSYGLLVYQDDLLFTAIELAGYNWDEVDKFRKAVGKKIPSEMAKQHEIFVEGCQKHSNMSESEAEKMWDLFEPFQGYGFNKAHAASYGMVSYQTAFMKANYPLEYMAAILTAESGDMDKMSEGISECKRMGIEVLPPDINESFGVFTEVDSGEVAKSSHSLDKERDDRPIDSPKENLFRGKIRFGLYSIKNFGEGIGNAIIEEREKRGKYKSLIDFLDRVKDKNLNKKSLESLIKCGAMDAFSERGGMLHNIEELLNYNKEASRQPEGQESLFGGISQDNNTSTILRLDSAGEASDKDKLSWEKELLGLYVSGHPLDKFKEKLDKRETNIKYIKEKMQEGAMTVAAGLIEEMREIITKKGDKMAFIKVSDYTDTMEIVIFPKLLENFKEIIVQDKCIVIKGRLSHRNGTPSIVAEAAKEMA